MLRVTLLGAGAVELDGQPVPELAAPRPLSLIAHLVLHRNAAQPRAAVAFTLWPESTEQQARTNLRHLLHDLRRAIPDLDGIVNVRRRTLQWRPDAQAVVDVIEFEEAASVGSTGDPEPHVRIARSEPLPSMGATSSRRAGRTGSSRSANG